MPPGTWASSCVQSINHRSVQCIGFFLQTKCVPSTGKSSNSSSSSSRAGVFSTGFEALAGSASVDFVGCNFAVSDMVTL